MVIIFNSITFCLFMFKLGRIKKNQLASLNCAIEFFLHYVP